MDISNKSKFITLLLDPRIKILPADKLIIATLFRRYLRVINSLEGGDTNAGNKSKKPKKGSR